MATFKNPLWEDPQTKTRVKARMAVDNGSKDIIIDRSDEKTWADLMSQFSEEQITKATEEDIERFRSEKKKREAFERDKAEREFQEMLFAEKLQALEIPEVKNNTNIALKRRLRKANNMLELHAYTAALVIDYDRQKQSDQV
jgi:hypothetical protein